MMQHAALLAGLMVCASILPSHSSEPVPRAVLEFLGQHCTDCHDGSTQKGGINLELEQIRWDSRADTGLLERVHQAIEKGEMPPKKKSRPPLDQSRLVLEWIDQGLVSQAPRQGTVFRRLNRAEYLRTVQRLFVGNFQLPAGFPEDSRAHGFDNVAEKLTLSPTLLESYGESAALIADRIFRLPRSASSRRQAIPLKEMLLQERDFGGTTTLLRNEAMRFALRGERSGPLSFRAPISANYRLHLKVAAVHPTSGQPMTLKIVSGGTDRLVPVDSTRAKDAVVELPVFEGGKIEFEFLEARSRFLTRGWFKRLRSELREQLEKDPRLLAAWLSFHEERTDKNGNVWMELRDSARPQGRRTDESIQRDYLARVLPEALASVVVTPEQVSPETVERLLDCMTRAEWFYGYAWNLYNFEKGPAIDLYALEIEGPLEQVQGPDDVAAKRTRAALIGNPPGQPGDADWLRHCVNLILQGAFRRAPEDAERMAYESLARAHLDDGYTAEEALNLVLRASLVSPHFLYREANQGGALPLHHLASRLSYFLSQGPPDPSLITAAENGSLARQEVLRSHALRLLGRPEVSAFVKNFTGQWLGTANLSRITPAPQLGKFDSRHLDGLTKEVEMLFEEILRENRPLSDFIDPDFTFTNFIVAKQIYGISLPVPAKGEQDSGMVRVSLPRGERRGGLLGMAGTMMATANGVDTQPVIRGKWVLENILGDPPPPPPPSVPAITPDTRGARTIRDLMAAHTTEESCAGCHRKLDPPGFLLENFDAIGNWRDHYPIHSVDKNGKNVSQEGPAVNASARLADGSEMRDVTDLKRYVVNHIEQFAGCVAEKLFTYGAGRVPNYAERKELHAASKQVLAAQEGFRDLLLAVVETEAFRSR